MLRIAPQATTFSITGHPVPKAEDENDDEDEND
jgi:hypothetical protein